TYLWLLFVFISIGVYIICDIIKILVYNQLYILYTMFIARQISDHVTSIFDTIQHYLTQQFAMSLTCLYSALSCQIISQMYRDINRQISDCKYEITPRDLRKLQ